MSSDVLQCPWFGRDITFFSLTSHHWYFTIERRRRDVRVNFDLNSIENHEDLKAEIQHFASKRLPQDPVEDFEEYQRAQKLVQALSDLGIEMFREKNDDLAEAIFLTILDNGQYTQPTFDRLSKIYAKRKDKTGLKGLLKRPQLKNFDFQGSNYLRDKIKEEIKKL